MTIKGCLEEDFINYKKPSMFIIFPYCSFKCDKENGNQSCQNWSLTKQPNIGISTSSLIQHYINNSITRAVVCGGLEPLDSFEDLYEFISFLRAVSDDDVVIYTGYNEDEIQDKLLLLKKYKNIIVKFGRFRPNENKHFDNVLGVDLSSDNQYAKRIS